MFPLRFLKVRTDENALKSGQKTPVSATVTPLTSRTTETSFFQQQEGAGLLVTDELEKALEYCKTRVARIAKECRLKNRKFRLGISGV